MRYAIRYVVRFAFAILLVLFLVGCASSPASQPPLQSPPQFPAGTYSRIELEEDFDSVANVLLSRNPLPFADKSELSDFIQLQRAKLHDGMREIDLYRILTQIVVKARCGHSGIFLSPATEARLRASQPYLPILVRILDGRLFVLSPLSSGGPPAASEIIAINGHPAGAIIRSLMGFITADGVNLTRKLYVAGRVFNDLYALFIDASPEFRVEYDDARDGYAAVVELNGISKPELERQASGAGFPYGLPEGGPRYSFSAELPTAAVLGVRTFSFPNGKPDYEEFLDHAFDAIRETRAKTLILDLRGNWGGDPEASAYLFARLIREPAPYFEPGTPLYGPLTHPLPPAPNAFFGRLIVLTDGACFSSTGHLCSLLRFYGLGTFLGEETGGSWTTADGAADYPLRRTGMRLRSSNRVFRTAVSGLPIGQGLAPDEEVQFGIEDIIAGRDPAMERALSLAEEIAKGIPIEAREGMDP